MNKEAINNAIAFAVGAAIGAAVTWKFVKTKYERIANEEIESVKETFYRLEWEEKQTNDDILEKYGYVIPEDEDEDEDEEEKEEDCMEDKPYVIEPAEFGECDGYQETTLHYYTDGILTDEDDNVIDNVDEIVGVESLSHFGEYEPDSVYVRNDTKKTDYEILMDYRDYYDGD